MSEPLTILCAGAYGIQNAGDDLPLINLAAGLRRRLPGREIRVRALSRHPDPWEEEAYGVTQIKNLEYESGREAAGRWFRGLNPGDDPAVLAGLRTEISACDLLVLGAGNFLLDQTIDFLRGPIPLFATYCFLARLYHKPVMLYGLSVGPLRTEWGRDLSRGMLENVTAVSVRDQASHDLAVELLAEAGSTQKVHLFPDAALACEPPAPERGREVLAAAGLTPPDNRPLLALGLRDLARPVGLPEAGRLEDSLVAMMNELKDEAAFLFVPQSTYGEDDDRELARRLAGRAPAGASCLVVEDRCHPLDLAALYGAAQATLAVRLHAAVFSATAGTPCAGISYLPKVAGFLENLGEPCRSYSLAEVDGAVLAAEARRLLTLSPAEQELMIWNVVDLATRARGHADLAASCIE